MPEETMAEETLTLTPNGKLSLLDVPIELEPVAPERVVAGQPREGLVEIAARFTDATATMPELGIWEMSDGTDTDVEADELFVVLAGSATLTLEKDGVRTVVDIKPGDLVQLRAGTHSTWEVRETVRKLYLCPPE